MSNGNCAGGGVDEQSAQAILAFNLVRAHTLVWRLIGMSNDMTDHDLSNYVHVHSIGDQGHWNDFSLVISRLLQPQWRVWICSGLRIFRSAPNHGLEKFVEQKLDWSCALVDGIELWSFWSSVPARLKACKTNKTRIPHPLPPSSHHRPPHPQNPPILAD